MSLTKEDSLAIRGILEPINVRFDSMQADIRALQSEMERMQLCMSIMQGGMEKMQASRKEMQANTVVMEACIEIMQTGMSEMQANVKGMQDKLNSVSESQVRLDQVHLPKIKDTLENFLAASEKDKVLDARISALEAKDERHSIDIAYLKGVIRS